MASQLSDADGSSLPPLEELPGVVAVPAEPLSLLKFDSHYVEASRSTSVSPAVVLQPGAPTCLDASASKGF